MGRLFDSNAEAAKLASTREGKESVRRRAEEIDQMLREEGELGATADKLGQVIAGQSMGVQAIHYQDYRAPGSKWMIEHAVVGEDYIYQMFPLRALQAEWRNTIVLLIAAMDTVFPRSIRITYSPPNERYQVKFFTLRVEKVVGQPGWVEACEKRALKALSDVQAWA